MNGGSALLRALPADFDATVVRGIDGRLAGCEAEHGVRILLAVESGSRPGAFPRRTATTTAASSTSDRCRTT